MDNKCDECHQQLKDNPCINCSGHDCCGIIKEDGVIHPPFLTESDIIRIENKTNFHRNNFVKQKYIPELDRYLSFLKVKSKGGCIFFDEKTGRCAIYNYHPLDCRLFPLDIASINNDYFLILYNYEKCNYDNVNIRKLVDDAKKGPLTYLLSDIKEYAAVNSEMALYNSGNWTKINLVTELFPERNIFTRL